MTAGRDVMARLRAPLQQLVRLARAALLVVATALVLWAWQPGEGRELPPVDLETWKKTVEEWVSTGAVIPSE